jgi:hypothetical protein
MLAFFFFIEKELDGSVVEVTWAKPIQKGVQRYSKRVWRRFGSDLQYVFQPATYHPQIVNVYNGRG